MRVSIIKIGNSQGIRLPKPVIKACGFEKEVELEIHDHEVLIRPITQPRHNWENTFKSMAVNGDDKLLELPETTWDKDEWQW